MRSALHTLGLLLVAVSLVGAGPGRCVMEARDEAPAERPDVPPCHEAPPDPPAERDGSCPSGPDGTAAACCAAPTAHATATAEAPSPAPTAVLAPEAVAAPARDAAWRTSPLARPPDRPPGAGLALFGCFRI